MRRTAHTSRRRKEFRCKSRGTRTWGSFSRGRGWRGGFIASSSTGSAGLERCSSIPAAAREPGDRRCVWVPARRLYSSSLSETQNIALADDELIGRISREKNQLTIQRRERVLRAGANAWHRQR